MARDITSKQPEKIPCPVCQERGRVRRQDKQFCTRCNGSGWVEGLFNRVLTCKKCGGNGHVIEFFEDVCLNCEGRGWIVRMVSTCPQCGRPQTHCSCNSIITPGEPA
jgi:DnaJ-class molecular chaperone